MNKKKIIILSAIIAVVVLLALIIGLFVFGGKKEDNEQPTTTKQQKTITEKESESLTEKETTSEVETTTEEPTTTEPETEIEPQYRETVGNYTETFVEGAYVLRTWSNGAERYYYYDADITETYYELSKEEFDGRIRPSRVTNAMVEVIEKMQAEYSATGSTSSDNTTSNSNNTTEPSTTASEYTGGSGLDDYPWEDPAAPINGNGVGAYDPDKIIGGIGHNP